MVLSGITKTVNTTTSHIIHGMYYPNNIGHVPKYNNRDKIPGIDVTSSIFNTVRHYKLLEDLPTL